MNQPLPFKRLSATSYNDNNGRRLNTIDDLHAPTSYAILDEGNGNHSLYTLNGFGELENKIDANWILMKGIEDTIFKTGLTHTEIELSDKEQTAFKAILDNALENMGGKEPIDLHMDNHSWFDLLDIMNRTSFTDRQVSGLMSSLNDKGLIHDYDGWAMTDEGVDVAQHLFGTVNKVDENT